MFLKMYRCVFIWLFYIIYDIYYVYIIHIIYYIYNYKYNIWLNHILGILDRFSIFREFKMEKIENLESICMYIYIYIYMLCTTQFTVCKLLALQEAAVRLI